MPPVYLAPAVEDRAIAVDQSLADHASTERPPYPRPLIAAAADGRLVVLHLDTNYELIAAVTGQTIERLVLSES